MMAKCNAERQYRRAFIRISDVTGGGRAMQGFSHACSSRTMSLNEIIMFLRDVFLAGLQEHGVLLRECSRWASFKDKSKYLRLKSDPRTISGLFMKVF